MLQYQLKPWYELTSCVKPSIMSCLLFGSVAGIHCVTTVFSSVQFLAYRWMYTADGVECYVTPLWRKENIRTHLCIQSGISVEPKDLYLLRRDRWVVRRFKLQRCAQLFSAVSSFLVCCCMRACEGSCCQHEILWLRWQRRQLPKPWKKVGGGGMHFSAAESTQRAPLTKQAESFPLLASVLDLSWIICLFFFITVK